MTFKHQDLLDSPINTAARANKIWLPYGKQAAPKPELSEAEKLSRLAYSRAARANAKARKQSQLNLLLDYYAATDVPVNRIADHTGMKDYEVIRELRQRGREV